MINTKLDNFHGKMSPDSDSELWACLTAGVTLPRGMPWLHWFVLLSDGETLGAWHNLPVSGETPQECDLGQDIDFHPLFSTPTQMKKGSR